MANKYGYMAKIGADTSGITRALSDLNTKISSTDKEIKALDRSIKSAEKAGTDTADLQRTKQEELRKAIADTTQKLQELQSVEQSVAQARDSGRITTEQYSQYRRELTDTQTALNRYQTQLADLTQTQQGSLQSTADLSLALQGVQAAYSQVAQDLSGIVNTMKDIAARAAEAAVGFGKSAYQVGSAFEAAMSKVQAYSGAVGDEFTALEEAAKTAGATTSKTASEAADALGYMALAGWDSEQMLEGLMPMIRAAEAGGGDLKRTSDLVTDSMSAMGIETENLAHYLDVCTAAQSSSNTTLNQLLEAYINVGGTMRNLNVPVEESATLLGVLANRGMKAREAGTALNSILVNLMGASESAKKALGELGVTAWNSDGSFKGVTNTLIELDAALKQCTEREKAFFEAKIGGKTQMDTLQALLSGVNEEYGDLYNTLTNVTGAADQTAETMQDNLVGAITTMKSAIEGLGVEFYDYMEAPIRDVVNTATLLVRELTEEIKSGGLGEKLGELSAKVSEILKKLIEWATSKGFDTAIKLLENLADGLNWIIDNMPLVISLVTEFGTAWLVFKGLKLATDIGILITSIQVLTTAAGGATAATTALSAAMSAIPAAAVALAISALGAAIGNYIVQCEIAKEKQNRLTEESERAVDGVNQYRRGVEDLNKQLDENAEKTEEQITLAGKAKENLEKLVDENGNVIGSQEAVEQQLGILNETFGIHLEVINGQIQGYKDLQAGYEGYVNSLREGILKEAEYEKYRQAVLDEQELRAKRNEYSNQRKENQIELFKTNSRIKELEELDGWLTFDEMVELDNLREKKEALEKEYSEVNQLYNAYAADYEKAHKFVTDYEAKLKVEEKEAPKTADTNKSYQSRAAEGEQQGKNAAIASQKAAKEKDKRKKDVLKQIEDIQNAYTTESIDEEEYNKQLAEITDNEENRRLFQDDPSSEFWRTANRIRTSRNKAATSAATIPSTPSKQTVSKQIDEKKEEQAEEKTVVKSYTDVLKDQGVLNTAGVLTLAAEIVADNTKINFDELENLYNNGADCFGDFVDEYTDIGKRWKDNVITAQSQLADEMAEISEKQAEERQQEIDNWKRDAETLKRERESFYQSRDKLAKSYMGGVQTSEVTDSSGKQRRVFDDLSKKTKELEQYNENIEKLSRMENIPQELLDDIRQLPIDERMTIVNELLKMGANSREQYFRDYSNYYAAAKKAADFDMQDEAEALNTKILEHNDTTKFENMGRADAQAFIDGWNGIISKQNLFDTVNTSPVVSTNGSTNGVNVGTNGSGEMFALPADTPINFNIAGVETVKTTLKNILSGLGLYGRSNRGL